jgi:type I restriction enzyme S subunit
VRADWKNVTLGEVARVFNGKTPSKAEQRLEGHPVLKIRDVNELGEYRGKFESFVDDELVTQFSEKRVCDGDTLILNAAHNADYVASKTYYAQPPTFGALATGEWLIVRPGEESLDSGFVHRWVTSTHTRRQLRELVNGIHLYPKDVARLKIPLPPLVEQRRIAEVLDRAEALRTKRRVALAQLDSLTQSLFLHLFGNPIQNERKWPLAELREISRVERGKFTPRPRGDPRYYGGRFPFIQTGDISSSGGRLNSWSQTLNEKGVSVSRSFPPGSVVIAIVGATLGITAILDIEVYCPDSVVGIQADAAKASPEYIERVLRFWRPIFVAQAPETARANINLETLRPLQVPLPPVKLQQEFARRVTAVETLKAAQRASLTELDALFATLQHRAFRGELTE